MCLSILHCAEKNRFRMHKDEKNNYRFKELDAVLGSESFTLLCGDDPRDSNNTMRINTSIRAYMNNN